MLSVYESLSFEVSANIHVYIYLYIPCITRDNKTQIKHNQTHRASHRDLRRSTHAGGA